MADSAHFGQAAGKGKAATSGTSAKVVSEVLEEEAGRLGILAHTVPGAAKGARPRRPVLGLALSGGGIRSATFALGVLQALAETKLILYPF